MVNYDKNSFLAGIAIGRQLKGWAQIKGTGGGGGDIPPVQVTTPPRSFTFPISTQLFCEQEGALIYYDLDGGTPATLYTGGDIPIERQTTLVTFAVFGRKLSVMSTYIYTFNDAFNHKEQIVIWTGPAPQINESVEIGMNVLAIEVTDDAVDISAVDYPVITEQEEIIIVEG